MPLSPLSLAASEWFCAGAILLTFGLLVNSLRRTLWGASSVADARRDAQRRRRQMMRDAGMCPDCGHSVRVDTDRCPECGSLAYSMEDSKDQQMLRYGFSGPTMPHEHPRDPQA